MNKLDKTFAFRDNPKFKIFNKVFTILVLLYTLSVIGLMFFKINIDIMIFMVIPLLLLVSFFRKNDYLFIIAEIITVIADFTLILYHKENIGFPIYILVQLTYAVYFYFRDKNRVRQITVTILRPFLMGIAVLAAYVIMQNNFNLVMAWAVMYYINLLTNIVCAIMVKDPLLIVGFALFAISDLIIGFNLILPSSNPLRQFLSSFNFLHFFYLISQTILIFNRVNNDYQRID